MKVFTGEVIGRSMDKTATVLVERFFAHSTYGKRVRRTKKYQVHDQENKSKVGDKVRFVASKPYSKTKKWKIIEIIDKNPKKKGKTK